MQTQDLIGQQLGNYRLTALLGKGGFARVYLGEHIFLGSQAKAAIKVLNETKLSDEDRQSFITEARTIRKLNHPRIVKLLEFGIELSRYVDGSIPYLVMDYAPDGTLRNRHPRNTAVPIQQIVTYMDQVADGLQYAHDQGTVHRDLKPENMLVMGVNDIVLSDFGIAITSYNSKNQAVTKDGVVQGTFAYIAPERFRGATRRASDQYSLGIVVYEWLTGIHPFRGNPEQIIYNHIHTPPPALYGVYPQISQEIEAVVMRALAKDPEQRYPSVKDFAQALNFAAQSVAQSSLLPAYGRGYTGQSEQKADLEYQGESKQPSDQQIYSEAVTKKASSDEYPGERTQPMDEQVDSRQRQTDSDEQLRQANTDKLQPINPRQQTKSSEQVQAHSEKQQQTDAGDQQQEEQANPAPQQQVHQGRQHQAHIGQQQVYPDFQTWQQIMGYSSARANRPTSKFKPEPPETSPVHLPKKGLRERFVETLRKWFELDPEFARIPRNKTFRNIGIVLNALSAILIGILAQPPSGWLMFWGLFYSLLFFNLCIRLVNVKLSIAAGLLVAVYWGYFGIVLYKGIYLYGPYVPKISSFLIAFLPPSLVALFFFIVSAYLHIRYVMNRLP